MTSSRRTAFPRTARAAGAAAAITLACLFGPGLMPASAAPQHSTNQCAIAVPGITTCTYIAGGQGWFTYAPGANVKLTILVNGQPATIIDQVWQPGGYMQGTFAATAGESVTLKLAAPVCEFCYVHVPSSGAAHAGDGTPAMIGPDAPQD